MADSVLREKVAQKECYETEYWLELLFETNCVPEKVYNKLQSDCGAIRRMLMASLETIKSK